MMHLAGREFTEGCPVGNFKFQNFPMAHSQTVVSNQTTQPYMFRWNPTQSHRATEPKPNHPAA